MKYRIKYTETALKDIKKISVSGNKSLQKKLKNIILELERNPFEGIGKPEKLKYEFSGLWSRRLNKEHRIIYSVFEDVIIVSVLGHYN